jgi:hypothetical protein
MTTTSKPGFEVKLNINALKHPFAYWEHNLQKIRAEIENQLDLGATYSIVSFIGDDPVLLFATNLALVKGTPDEKKYDEILSKVAAVIALYDA